MSVAGFGGICVEFSKDVGDASDYVLVIQIRKIWYSIIIWFKSGTSNEYGSWEEAAKQSGRASVDPRHGGCRTRDSMQL